MKTIQRIGKLLLFKYQERQAQKIYSQNPTAVNAGRLDTIKGQIRCIWGKLAR